MSLWTKVKCLSGEHNRFIEVSSHSELCETTKMSCKPSQCNKSLTVGRWEKCQRFLIKVDRLVIVTYSLSLDFSKSAIPRECNCSTDRHITSLGRTQTETQVPWKNVGRLCACKAWTEQATLHNSYHHDVKRSLVNIQVVTTLVILVRIRLRQHVSCSTHWSPWGSLSSETIGSIVATL